MGGSVAVERGGVQLRMNGFKRRSPGEKRYFQLVEAGGMDILPPMTSQFAHSPEGPSQVAWLASLPRKRVREVKAALADLPVDIASAGGDLLLVIAAWSRVDPVRAAQLLEQWIATADEEGNLTPSSLGICQLASGVIGVLPDPDPFLARILPGLSRCVLRNFERYDESGTGLPRWPSAEEALFPAEFAPGRFTVDLAVLLANEATVFSRLSEGNPAAEKAAIEAEGEERDLEGWLLDQFWNEEQSLFYRYDGEGETVPDRSLCGMIPLVWKGRTAEITEGIRPRAAGWTVSDWPPRAWILFFVWLQRTPHQGVLAQMRASGLPAGASKVEQAIWTVLRTDSEARSSVARGDMPEAVHWMEAHGRLLRRIAIVGGGLLLLVLLGWQVFHRESEGGLAFSELERRARQASADGQHGRAAVLYGQAARQGREAYYRYRQAGEWLHIDEAAAAEQAYRELLLEEPDAPNVQINLALAVWRQGRSEEALDLYRAFAESQTAYPELVARAALAAELIERQLALDREE